MPNGILIRTATIDDARVIVGFNLALAAESEGMTLDEATVAKGVGQAIGDPKRCHYYLAEVGGQVVGQTMITREWSDWRNGWFWWIQSVYVDPAFRRRGVFRSLHTHIRDEARSHADVCGLRLYVHHDNQHAITTYQQLGMKVSAYRLCEDVFVQP